MYKAAVLLILLVSFVHVVLVLADQRTSAAVLHAVLHLILGVSVISLLPGVPALTILLACLLTSATLMALLTPFLPIPPVIPSIALAVFAVCTIIAFAYSLICPSPQYPTSVTLPAPLPSPASSSTSFPLTSRLSHEKNINSVSSSSTDPHTSWQNPQLETLHVGRPAVRSPRVQFLVLQGQILAVFSLAVRLAAAILASHPKTHMHVFRAFDVSFLVISALFISLALYQHAKILSASQGSSSIGASQSMTSSVTIGPYSTPPPRLNPRPRTHSLTRPLPLLEQQSLRASCATTTTIASSKRSSVQTPKKAPANLNLSFSWNPCPGSDTPSRPKRAYTICTTSSSPSEESSTPSSRSYPSPPPSPSEFTGRSIPVVIRSKSRGLGISKKQKHQQAEEIFAQQQQQVYFAGMTEMGLVSGHESDEDFRDLRDPFASSGVVRHMAPVPPPVQFLDDSSPRPVTLTDARTGNRSRVEGNPVRKSRSGSLMGKGRAQRMSAWGKLHVPLPPLSEIGPGNMAMCKYHSRSFAPTSLPSPGVWIGCTCTRAEKMHKGEDGGGSVIDVDMEEALLTQRLLTRLSSVDGGLKG